MSSRTRFDDCPLPTAIRRSANSSSVRVWLGSLVLLLSGCLSHRVSSRFPGCRLERECGALLGVDCHSAVDGPYWYVRKADLTVVAACGGFCMEGQCTNCPPKEWTCQTY
jgi:hypothetical protein